eukprot:929837_1
MIVVISPFRIFSIMAFTIISQMDFPQIPITIHHYMHHCNAYQHIYPIKSHTNQLNDQLQQPTTYTQKSLKIYQKINQHYKIYKKLINMDQSHQYQCIYPIKSHTNLLNDQSLLSSVYMQN